jgi:hypothetical protein
MELAILSLLIVLSLAALVAGVESRDGYLPY